MNSLLIGGRLVSLRGSKTKEEVAFKVSISVAMLSLYETGKRIPKDEIKIRMANYYGRTVQELFYD